MVACKVHLVPVRVMKLPAVHSDVSCSEQATRSFIVPCNLR